MNTKQSNGADSPFVFRSPVNYQQKGSPQFFRNAVVEMAAAVTAVTVYHPLRTIATQLSKGDRVRWKFTPLYKGFFASAFGAHQLFLMGEFERRLRLFHFQGDEQPSLVNRMTMGAFAGFLTAPTVTPSDMVMVQRQLNQPLPVSVSTLFRGFFPVAFRQAGLGAGMFILPDIFNESLQHAFPELAEKHHRPLKIGSAFLAGVVTATMTQGFEIARLLMQGDPRREKYNTTWSAFKAVPKEMATRRGWQIFAARLSVLGVATVVMSNARELYSKWLPKAKEKV